MEKIITVKSEYDSTTWINDITREMDEHLIKPRRPGIFGDIFRSYIYRADDPMKEGHYLLRYPGATRGCIIVDKDMVIQEIKLYDDTCFDLLKIYRKDILPAMEQFIGKELDIKNV